MGQIVLEGQELQADKVIQVGDMIQSRELPQAVAQQLVVVAQDCDEEQIPDLKQVAEFPDVVSD